MVAPIGAGKGLRRPNAYDTPHVLEPVAAVDGDQAEKVSGPPVEF